MELNSFIVMVVYLIAVFVVAMIDWIAYTKDEVEEEEIPDVKEDVIKGMVYRFDKDHPESLMGVVRDHSASMIECPWDVVVTQDGGGKRCIKLVWAINGQDFMISDNSYHNKSFCYKKAEQLAEELGVEVVYED